MKFSLILPTVDRTRELRKFLDSLVLQSHTDFEVVIVDQNPDDRVTIVLRSYADRLPMIHVTCDRGLSKARNAGIRRASGTLFAFPDDDCWYPPALLQDVHQWFVDHPDWDGLTTRVADEQGEASVIRFDKHGGGVSVSNLWGRLTSISMFFTRKLIRDVGDFDERLGRGAGTQWGSGEDLDYPIRAFRQGYRIYFEPALWVGHPAVRDRYQTARQRREFSYAYGLGAGHVLKKHRLSLRIKLYLLLRPVGGLLLSALRLDAAKSLHHYYIFLGRLRGMM